MTTQDMFVFTVGFVAGLSFAVAALICFSYFAGNSLRKAEQEGEGSNL